MSHSQDSLRLSAGAAAVFFGAIGTGFAPIFVRFADVGPAAIGAWRQGIAALILIALMVLLTRKPGPRPEPTTVRDFMICAGVGLFFAADVGFFHASLELLPIAHANLIVTSGVIVSGIGGSFLFKDRVGWPPFAGLLISFSGLVLMVGISDRPIDTLGLIYAIIAMLAFAAYVVAVKFASQRLSTNGILRVSAIAAAPVLIAASLILGEKSVPDGWDGLWPLLGIGIVCQICGQGLITKGLSFVPIAIGTTLMLTTPVAAAVFGWILFDEAMDPIEIAGAAMVLAGIAVATLIRPPARS
ncbi:MAG: DMT family transporter [Alphaproteobacteria bacterium]|nr:DMT family transporter [Alphaproteobacteria bacterium]